MTRSRGYEHVLRPSELRYAEERLGERPFLERERGAIGDNLRQAASELGSVHLAAENAEVDAVILEGPATPSSDIFHTRNLY